MTPGEIIARGLGAAGIILGMARFAGFARRATREAREREEARHRLQGRPAPRRTLCAPRRM